MPLAGGGLFELPLGAYCRQSRSMRRGSKADVIRQARSATNVGRANIRNRILRGFRLRDERRMAETRLRLGPLARQPERATSGNVYLYLSRFSKLTNSEKHYFLTAIIFAAFYQLISCFGFQFS